MKAESEEGGGGRKCFFYNEGTEQNKHLSGDRKREVGRQRHHLAATVDTHTLARAHTQYTGCSEQLGIIRNTIRCFFFIMRNNS